jgi:protein ImuB
MRRVISAWLPTLPTDQLRKLPDAPPPDVPLVTRTRDGGRQVIAAADRIAQALGLLPGLPVAEAQARVPTLDLRDAEPAADAEALRRMAAWCLRYTPLVAPVPPDGLLLDVTGCAHLRGGEDALLRDLTRRIERAGFACRAAVADTPGAAYAVARFGDTPATVVRTGEAQAALAGLPLAALRISPAVARSLHLLGFERVCQLLAAPRAPLVRRFGPSVLRLLDQALGVTFEPIRPWLPAEAVQHRTTFVEPLITAEALGVAIDRLVALACADLRRQGLGASRVDVLFERVDGGVQGVRIGTARPSRDDAHLSHMLRERLETVEPGFGIEAARLVVALAGPLAPEQAATSADAAVRPADIPRLVDRIGNRLGAGRVFRVAPTESDVPERSQRRVPPLERPQGAAWPTALPRPVRIFAPPHPVEALAALPDRPPAAFTWARVRRRVRRADGPERITGEWWLRDAETHAVRDYWQVEDEEGHRYWLFRRGDGERPHTGDLRWFLHGLF